MNDFLAVAPQAVPFASHVSVMTSLNDQADRAGRGLADGETFSTGKKMWQWIDTPHVPHGWDCGVLFDQSTGTLLCGEGILSSSHLPRCSIHWINMGGPDRDQCPPMEPFQPRQHRGNC